MDEDRPGGLLSGLSWVLLSNLIFIGSSALLVLLLPRWMSVDEYAAWQKYLFFALYLGYVTFGYTDGVVLRLGGTRYGDLRPPRATGSFVIYAAFEWVAFAIILVAAWLSLGVGVAFALAIAGVCFYVPRTLVSVVLQTTGRSKAFALSNSAERLVLSVLALGLLVLGGLTPVSLMVADIFSKAMGLFVSLWLVRDLWFNPRPELKIAFVQLVRDSRSGLYILGANLAAVGVPGIARLAAESGWGSSGFAEVSLAFQLLSFVSIAVTSLSMAAFPQFRRLQEDSYGDAFRVLRRAFVLPSVALFLAGPVAYVLVNAWLPEYSVSAVFVAALIPMVLFESKGRGLANAVLRSKNRQAVIMWVNAGALGVAAVGAYLAVSFRLGILSLAFVVLTAGWMRSLLLDGIVSREIGVPVFRDNLAEGVVAAFYVWATVTGFAALPTVCAGVAWLGYMVLYRGDLQDLMRWGH